MGDVMTESKVFELCTKMRHLGYAVICFTPEELRGANPDHVEDRLVELGWDVIDTLATDAKDLPTEEDWNWSIK
jgi:hypothetical protein